MGEVVEDEEVGSGECTIVEVKGSLVCRLCIGGEGYEKEVEGWGREELPSGGDSDVEGDGL